MEQNKTSHLRRYFFTGILVTAPVGLTLYLTWLFIAWTDRLITPHLPAWMNPDNVLPVEVPGVGLIVTFVSLTTIGWIMAGVLGHWFTRSIEIVMNRLPVVKTIYTVIKQILQTALADQSKSFREPVMVQFPHENAWALAFVTSRSRDAVDLAVGSDVVSIFVPTAPNPTSGFLIFVEESRLRPVKMSAEEAMKTIVSVGLAS